MPTPFIDETFDFTQPDGSVITVKGTGNQYRAQFQTLQGQPVVWDSAGFLVVAPASGAANLAAPDTLPPGPDSAIETIQSRWQVRRELLNEIKAMPSSADIAPAPPARQTIGAIVGLTLLVDFPDVPHAISQQEVEQFCNQPGYAGFGNKGSVRDYFHDVSNGLLTYTNVVAPYFTASKIRDYYTDPSQPYGSRAQELIGEALTHLIASGFNLAPLSADSGRFIYALNLFYAGPRVNGWGQGLWPHQSSLSNTIKLADGRTFADYQITNMDNRLTLGTFCHENGHMVCDFPDLYRYAGTGSGTGYYCLMCYGGSGGGGTNPAQVSAYLKNEAGWGTATPMRAGSTLSLPASGNQFAIFNRSAQEYFIIENRQSSGRDSTLPSNGLAIWYIDERASNTDPALGYECELLQADGRSDLQAGANIGDGTDFFSSPQHTVFAADTTPSSNWRGGLPSGLKIDQISASGAVMTFKVN